MAFEATYPRVGTVTKDSLRWLWWSLFFFVLINTAVWYVFDLHFVRYVDFGRLLNEPSENEMMTILEELKEDDREHIVLVGDSVIAGVGEAEQNIASSMLQEQSDQKVVNLGSPAESYLDEIALVLSAWKPQDTYILFLNPIWFDREPSVQFPIITSTVLGSDYETLSACCQTETPKVNTYDKWATKMLRALVPLYRNRDVLNHALLGAHPSTATDVVLGRVRNSLTTETPSKNEPVTTESAESAPLLEQIKYIATHIAEKENIYVVLLDDQWFDGTAPQEDSIENLFPSNRFLNLQNSFQSELFKDRTHLNANGHSVLADELLRLLDAS